MAAFDRKNLSTAGIALTIASLTLFSALTVAATPSGDAQDQARALLSQPTVHSAVGSSKTSHDDRRLDAQVQAQRLLTGYSDTKTALKAHAGATARSRSDADAQASARRLLSGGDSNSAAQKERPSPGIALVGQSKVD